VTSSEGRGPQPVVTMSASYGAGGSAIAPALAERLGLRFVDRLLSADTSDEASATARSEEGLSAEEEAAMPSSRLFTYLARAAGVGAITAPPPTLEPEEDLRERAEEALTDVRAGAGAVVLGRGGAVALAERPRCYHVRLDGPVERRVRLAAALEGISEERAAHRRGRADRARELWVKRLYRADPLDPAWYHLWLDTTVLGVDSSVDLLALAVEHWLTAAP
jgi:cytidylate kinase